MKKKGKRIFRQATTEERERIADLQNALDRELPEIKLQARQVKMAHIAAKEAIERLRTEHERQGLSLADVSRLSGIGREALCKIENNEEANPTVRTLVRYADAVGLGIVISFQEVGESDCAREYLHRVTGTLATPPLSTDFEVPLTQCESEVLRQLACGLTNKEIAKTLHISYETVKEHIQHILRKLNCTDRTQAAVWAVRKGLG